MALLSRFAQSVRPSAQAHILGVGNGSGSSLTGLYKLGALAAHVIDIRARSDATAGLDARVLYARLHQYGVGGGEAVRAYAFANVASCATGGTLNGLHASVSVATSSSISGAANAIRATFECAASTNPGGTIAAIQADTNIGGTVTLPGTHAFIRFTNTGSTSFTNLFNIPNVASAGMLAAHTTEAMSHSIRIVSADGTKYYLMVATDVSHRTGGG